MRFASTGVNPPETMEQTGELWVLVALLMTKSLWRITVAAAFCVVGFLAGGQRVPQ